MKLTFAGLDPLPQRPREHDGDDMPEESHREKILLGLVDHFRVAHDPVAVVVLYKPAEWHVRPNPHPLPLEIERRKVALADERGAERLRRKCVRNEVRVEVAQHRVSLAAP
jgi:hypothetical protein